MIYFGRQYCTWYLKYAKFTCRYTVEHIYHTHTCVPVLKLYNILHYLFYEFWILNPKDWQSLNHRNNPITQGHPCARKISGGSCTIHHLQHLVVFHLVSNEDCQFPTRHPGFEGEPI